MIKLFYILISICILIIVIIRSVKYNSIKVNPVKKDENRIIKKADNKEVYNIGENIYTYYDAPFVCKMFGGRLATFDELKEEYKKGADWCNYGWSEGQHAYYPTQKETWDKLQKNGNNKDMCGIAGINGGYFDNPDLKFGVNCYGIKPPKTSSNSSNITLKTPEELEAENKMKALELTKNKIQILPFNKNEWSLARETTSNNFISNNI